MDKVRDEIAEILIKRRIEMVQADCPMEHIADQILALPITIPCGECENGYIEDLNYSEGKCPCPTCHGTGKRELWKKFVQNESFPVEITPLILGEILQAFISHITERDHIGHKPAFTIGNIHKIRLGTKWYEIIQKGKGE